MYNEDHRLYNPCKICVAINSTRHYQANRDKIFARSKLYQGITKSVKKHHPQQIQELTNKVEELTRTMEMLILKK